MTLRLALKIDVDTYRGIAVGATRLAEYLHTEKIPASFFVTMGPDTSGWAATRVFRHRGFLKKMQRTSAVQVYGWRTVFSGTLWPARPMAASFADRLKQWRDWGLEVSPHGYDHIRWHDQAAGWDEDRAVEELDMIVELYRHVLGEVPQSFAAPGWQAGAGTWKAMERMNLLYHSDTRGERPFRPCLPSSPAGASRGSIDSPPVAAGNDVLRTPEIPTTLPTWDEMLAWDGVTPETLVERTLALMKPESLNVWTIHAEFEGTGYFDRFRQLIESLRRQGATWVSLRELAEDFKTAPEKLPAAGFVQGTRPGRAGTVTCQAGLP